ncbi:unnamed protein product [Alopecurus aequalis]
MVAATHVGVKRRRAGQHLLATAAPPPAPAAASLAPPAPAGPPAPVVAPPKLKARPKRPSLGPKGAKAAAGGVKTKRTNARSKPPPPPAPAAAPPPVVHEVLDGMPTSPTSFMDLLEDAEVDLGAPPLEPFGFGHDLEDEGDEEEEGEDDEEVEEIEEEAFAAVAKPTVRSSNYSEDEDILLEGIADLRYKEMAASKGKAFPFKHVWKLLQTYDKWKLRDQETAPKKSAMLRMDDSDEEARNERKPEGTKKAKLRKEMEGEASSIREKMEHMMKSREALTMKTLETKLLINEKKKEVKLAQVQARREEAMRKADLEDRMIKVKEAKAWKELMAEEKEHMMMSKKDMDEDQLAWWKEYKEDIAKRKRIFRGASSTLRGTTPMSGGGDGGVEDSTTGDNGGA